MKSRLVKIAVIVFALLVIAAILLKLRYDRMVDVLSTTVVEDVDLNMFSDGVYSGEFGDFLVSVSVDVIVEEHRICDILITDQRCGNGYEALETIDRIIEAQEASVDAVTGATSSSRCIMLAVNRALSSYEH